MMVKLCFILFVNCVLFGFTHADRGAPAKFGQFPSVLFIETPSTYPCVGTLIENKHILTSAQCVIDSENKILNSFFFRIIAGDLNLVQPSVRRVIRRITHIYIHPDFDPVTKVNDIAVLRVDQDFPHPHNTVEVVRAYSEETILNPICQFAAWSVPTLGATAIDNELRFYRATMIDKTQCNDKNNHNGKVKENMICAGDDTESKPYPGSLGSALFCHGKLVGVLSFGIDDGPGNLPGVYTDVRKYFKWIEDQFKRTDYVLPGTSII